MGNFNIMGSYSGIDMSVIDQMIEAEKSKGVQFTNRKDKIEREQGAWKDVGTRLNSLTQKTNALNQRSTFESRTVNSTAGSNSAVSVSAGNSAPVGNYQLSVNQLATSSRIIGGQVTIPSGDDKTKPIDRALGNEGSFNFQNAEGTSFQVKVSNEDSLRDITRNINAQTKESGIEASIVDNRLILKDTKMGERAITIKSTDVAGKLGFGNSVEGTGKSQSVTYTGTQAEFTIDGVKITRDTNRISDAIEGIAFTLESTHADGASEVISITNNTQKGVDAMKEFVDQYNSVMNFIQTQTDVGSPGEDNNTTGALVGEGSIMRLQSGLRTTLMQRINGKSMSDFGVEIDRYGVATLDEAKLNKALQDDPTSVSRFFYRPELAPDGTGDVPKGEEPKDTQGMSELFKNFLETYTARSKGIISTKNQSYDRMVKQINEQIETFNERIDRKRDRYIQQFAALDEAMMRAESQMEYLYSQMNIEQR